jgi:hypothetical protein
MKRMKNLDKQKSFRYFKERRVFNTFFHNLKGGELMSKGIKISLLVLVFLSFSLSGCYYFSATKEMKAAEQLLSELKASDGGKLAPYEYCSAEKFLENAKGEAAESDYKAAKGFASRSKSASQTGLDEIKKNK